MPIGAYAGLDLTAARVRDVVTNPDAQVAAVLAMRERLGTPFLLTAMDLSAEAEAFGASVRLTDHEIPAIVGRLVRSAPEAAALPTPSAGDGRTAVHLAAARRLVVASRAGAGAGAGAEAPVIGGMIGPFSLAARLFGVAEALEATLAEPTTIHAILVRVTPFLIHYARAFRSLGAAGVIVAEPAAGLLSPRGLAAFSTPYVRRIVDAVQDDDFSVVLHNCGAKLVHLERILECGAAAYHFGAPMDVPAAVAAASAVAAAGAGPSGGDGRPVICGNVDPTFIHSASPDTVHEAAVALLSQVAAAGGHFVLSSGCDLPPGTPLDNVAALCRAGGAI